MTKYQFTGNRDAPGWTDVQLQTPCRFLSLALEDNIYGLLFEGTTWLLMPGDWIYVDGGQLCGIAKAWMVEMT